MNRIRYWSFRTLFVLVLALLGCKGGTTQAPSDQIGGDSGSDTSDGAVEVSLQDAGPDTEVPVDAALDGQPPDAPWPTLSVSSDPSVVAQQAYYQAKHQEMLDLLLTADQVADLTDNRLCITHYGMGPVQDIQSLTLLDQDFMRFSMDDLPFDQATGRVCFTGLHIAAPSGQMIRVRVLVRFQASQPVGEHGLAIEQPSDIGLDQAAQIQGPFPIKGPLMSLGNEMATELVYAYDGPTGEVQIQAGIQYAQLLELSALSPHDRLSVMAQHLFLVSRDGGLVRGTQGTFYLDYIQFWDGDKAIGTPYAMEDHVAWGINAAYLDISPSGLGLDPSNLAHLRITASLKSTEDAPGEFFGHAYSLAIKLPGADNDVSDLTFGDTLDPGQISPQDDIEGSLRRILAP